MPASIANPERATVEDDILALPLCQVHEENAEAYRKEVLAARSAPENRDRLYIAGDGSFPLTLFHLVREEHRLEIFRFEGAADAPPSRYAMTRFKGQWQRGDSKPWSGRAEDAN